MLTEERAITAATVDDVDVRQFRNHLARQGLAEDRDSRFVTVTFRLNS